jgi:hypothetical protein
MVSGIAGSVRIRRLKAHELGNQEAHGKRLDVTGRARQIRDTPPLTTTGLDLVELRNRHVEGAMVPGGDTVALHLLLQFPTDLVDPGTVDDPEAGRWMLDHARKFANVVFGDQAVFADRLDRDEKGRHVVDVFLAPKYIKRTKHSEKQAVSISRHLKELAVKHGTFDPAAGKVSAKGKPIIAPNLHNQGQALQTAFFEYLRDEAKLVGVQRGNAKVTAGDDWVSPEQVALKRQQDALKAQQARFDMGMTNAAAKSVELVRLERDIAVRGEEAARALSEARRVEEDANRLLTAVEQREAALRASERATMVAIGKAELVRRAQETTKAAQAAEGSRLEALKVDLAKRFEEIETMKIEWQAKIADVPAAIGRKLDQLEVEFRQLMAPLIDAVKRFQEGRDAMSPMQKQMAELKARPARDVVEGVDAETMRAFLDRGRSR